MSDLIFPPDVVDQYYQEGREALPDHAQCNKCHYFDANNIDVQRIIADRQTWPQFKGMNLLAAASCKCGVVQESHLDRSARSYNANFPPRRDAIGPRTFENFNVVDGTAGAYEAAQEWARGEGLPFLFLTGTTGCGKTHLAEAALRLAYSRVAVVRYESVPLFLQEIRLSFDNPKAENPLHFALNAKFLALDDICAEKSSEWVMEQLGLAINKKYESGDRVVLTTNLGEQSQIADRLGDRVASRLWDTRMVRRIPVWAKDYRTGGR